MLFYEQTVKQTLEKFRTNAQTGLSPHEVSTRRRQFGPNELTTKTTPLYKKLLAPFLDTFMLMLLAALILSIIQLAWTEVLMIAIIISITPIM